jgi:hypothetical protein
LCQEKIQTATHSPAMPPWLDIPPSHTRNTENGSANVSCHR